MAPTTSEKQWASQYPELGTDPIPTEPCLSQDYFEKERERIYRKTWINVGRIDELPRNGDFFVRDLAVIKSSILIVRGKDGEIRGFHNVCTHRGNKVARESRGNSNLFVCGFHGWVYDLQGNLGHVTDEDQFFDLDKSSCGLTPVATDVWEGFIFINVDPQPSQTLTEFLGEWGRNLSGYQFGSMYLRDHYETEINVNWKIALDAFQEAWHARFVHKRSGGEAYASEDNPYIHVLQFKLYPLHRMMSVPGNPQFVPTPIQICAHQFGTSYIKREEKEVELPPGLNPTRSPMWMFDSNYIFPNFSIFLFDGMYFTYHFWPVSADRTVFETRTYYPPAQTAGQRFSQEYAKCVLRDTWLEDLSTLENIQTAISSGSVPAFVLQDQEILVRHSHKVIADHVEG